MQYWAVILLLLALQRAATCQPLVVPGLPGVRGGGLVYAQRTEPKTFNPATAADSASREVIHRMMADLIHINRESQQTELALAKSWSVSADGLRYVIELREGIRFSDGHPFDADDVVFTFQVILDEKVHSPQRDLLFLDGKPIVVRKLEKYKVAFQLPLPYAAAERLFDGFSILPSHLLEKQYAAGKLNDAWGLSTPPSEIAGLGPFRLKEYVAGQRVTLERNPYYWKTDKSGNTLPYLDRVDFLPVGSEDNQVLRFQAGESDVISRVSAKNFAVLEKDQERRGYTLRNLGPGLEYSFLFFNLGRDNPVFRIKGFRQAVSTAIDRDAITRLVYLGNAVPLASPVPPGNRAWVDNRAEPTKRSLPQARQLLSSSGFSWASDGSLRDPQGKPVEFSIVTSAGNNERQQMATLIQDDLKPLGMRVQVVTLEMRSLLDRVTRTREYDAGILSFASGDADPNADMNVWLSSGGNHLWNPEQKSPATPWEAEIDDLMHRQMVSLNYGDRKRLFDRVQQLLRENLPLIPLVSPSVLVGAKRTLRNFRPALLDHYVLWNMDTFYWIDRR